MPRPSLHFCLEPLFIIRVIQHKSLELNVSCHAVKIKIYLIVLWEHKVPKKKTTWGKKYQFMI